MEGHEGNCTPSLRPRISRQTSTSRGDGSNRISRARDARTVGETTKLFRDGITDASVTVIVAYRDTELREDATRQPLMSDLLCQPNVNASALGGLTSEEVGAFVEATVGARPKSSVIEYLIAQTGGNPFYLTQVVPLLDGSGPKTSSVGAGELALGRLAFEDAAKHFQNAWAILNRAPGGIVQERWRGKLRASTA